MRKLVVSMFVSLDGLMEDPAWTQPYWNDDIAKFKFDELVASDALLLGRVTYQSFAASWPTTKHAKAMESAFSALPKPGEFSQRMKYPIVLGRGKRRFEGGGSETLELIEAKPLRSNVVHLSYRPLGRNATFATENP